jgi:anti-sigma-K factor RskA
MKDETLILYYYRDGLSADERREIATALSEDAALAERYRSLSRDLDALREPADLPMPEGLTYRLQASLQRAARLEEAHDSRRSRSFSPWSFALGGALAAALAVGIGMGLWMAGDRSPGPPMVAQTAPAESAEWSPVAFQRGLESHFRSSRADLANLSGDAGQDRAALVATLMQQNRLFAQLALQNDAPELARVLRSFEPILMQLGREDLSPQEAANLQAQLEFEFQVMLTKLLRGSSQQPEPHKKEMTL